MFKKTIPSELYECKRFISWLRSKSYRFTHVPNESFSKRQGLKNKSLGVSAGFPDYIVLLPNKKLLFIEMKRSRPARSKVSPEQKLWLEALTLAGFPSMVCYGFEEAKRFVETYENERTD